jgi:hypothetical protein
MINQHLMASTFSEVMTLPERMENLMEKMAIMEKELEKLRIANSEGWMSLQAASAPLKKTPDAIRQRLKHPTKPMPEVVVWKQEAKGYEIYVHLGNFRKYK